MTVTTYTVTVAENKAGTRLDRVLAEALPDLSRNRLQMLIRSGSVASIGGERVHDPAFRVDSGSAWRVDVDPLPEPNLAAEDIALDIVFEDDDVIVVDKPPGLVVHPGAGNPAGTLVNALLQHCAGNLARAGGSLRPGIVHRLDKDTSGLIVAAKTDRAYVALVEQFASHTIERAYYAVVRGVPLQPAGRIAASIGRSPVNRKKMATLARGGKAAITDYRLLQPFATTASLVECRPLTGRTHQIRVHMAALGHPLLGDPLYGRQAAIANRGGVGRGALSFDRQALHAFLIGFRHPRNAEWMLFRSEIPNDIRSLLLFLERL